MQQIIEKKKNRYNAVLAVLVSKFKVKPRYMEKHWTVRVFTINLGYLFNLVFIHTLELLSCILHVLSSLCIYFLFHFRFIIFCVSVLVSFLFLFNFIWFSLFSLSFCSLLSPSFSFSHFIIYRNWYC